MATAGNTPVPPSDQLFVAGGLVAYLPVELRNEIVNPAVACPQQHIGIEVVVVLQAAGRTAVGRGGIVAVYAKRTDSEPHPGFAPLDVAGKLSDKRVDIAAPPLVEREAVAIQGIAGSIGNGTPSMG